MKVVFSCVWYGVVESGEWRVESGEWRVESGEWRVESGEWRVESGEAGPVSSHQYFEKSLISM